MRRFALTLLAAAALTLGLGGVAPSRAQAAPGAAVAIDPAAARGATERAAGALAQAQKAQAALVARKAALQKQYDGELREIDRLKQQRASWYRDRQLRGAMAQSLETAKRLAGIEAQLRAGEASLRGVRLTLLAAIDVELSATPDGGRRADLLRLRAGSADPLRKAGKKIVLPDDRIDPLADPEELEQQAVLLRQSERQLTAEMASLTRQVDRYQRMEQLRKKHERADQLARLEDDQPRRSTGQIGAAGREGGASVPLGSDDDAADPTPQTPETDGASGEGPGGGGGPPDLSDADPVVVLADVVDAETIDALRKAERSGDPAAKARAADRAARKVEDRLRRLRAQRAAIEKRAAELRRD
jgi:hypothetical protein